MKPVRMFIAAACAAVLALAAATLVSCQTDTPNSIERNVGVDYSGVYSGRNEGGGIATRNSGTLVTQFDLRQTGASLQAIDNLGAIWEGDIGNAPDAENLTATITLEGKTSAGQKVTISGTISKDSAGATTATMSGTWIEPDFYATVYAIGSVAATSTNSGGGAISVSPQSATVAIGSSQSFTASGSSGTITWSVSGFGTLSTTTGNSTTFTRTSSGSATLTATDNSGKTGSATIN